MSDVGAERITREDLVTSARGLIDFRAWGRALRSPRASMQKVTGTGPIYPLLILFGLNTVDELDRTAFGILLPNIRDAFGMSNTGILTLVGLAAVGAFAMQMPVAAMADRGNRVAIAMSGAALWAAFSVMTGAASALWMLIIARAGAGIGRAVVDPTHNSLLSDYYSVDRRPAVFSFHRAGNVLGNFVGPIAAGALAAAFTWRTPFYVFAVPTIILVLLGLKMREPLRGRQERLAAGADEAIASTEEHRPSFAESWRLLWKIEVLRRIWYAVPFLSIAVVGFISLGSLLYEEIYRLDELDRGYLAAAAEPFQFLGLAFGARLGTRLFLKDPALIFRFLKGVAFVAAVMVAAFALSPVLWLTVVANIGLTTVLAILTPGIFATLSLAIPARSRAVGFSIASWWAIPGLGLLPLIGWVSDRWGIRPAMLVMVPVLLVGGLMIAAAGKVVKRDIADVWAGSAARSEAVVARAEGRSKLLVVRGLEVSYGPLRVLHDIDLEVAEGEVLALLGTNGAGKSTLLRAISGVTEADFGAVVLDGRDITHAPPNEIAELGIAQVPGGRGVFPSLSVGENLQAASWSHRKDRAEVDSRIEDVLEVFPILAERLDEPASNLSGGQQQMLALGMALLSRPRVLLIDELSLGLAPIIVGQLAELVRQVAAEGTTVILVEQSVNVALTMATRAVFLERGRIRYTGAAEELLDHPELLRSVFLADGATSAHSGSTPIAMNGGPALELVGVTRRFGGITAVSDVSLSVHPAEIVGFIGQNGAGKTTLFDLVCGYQPLDGGHIAIAGEDVSGLAPYRRALSGLGRTFQGGRLFPALTVRECLAVSLDRSVDARDMLNAALRLPAGYDSELAVAQRVDELVGLFGLGPHEHRFVSELSTGTRRIVELACAVGHQPSVLLLDEPAAGVAQREVELLSALILRIRAELGCALVLIEHDMPLIASVSDRLVAFETGQVIAEGDPQSVLSDARVVAAYLGDDHAAVSRSDTSAPMPGEGGHE